MVRVGVASVGLARHRALNVWDRAASDSGKRYSGWPDGDHCWGHKLVLVVDGRSITPVWLFVAGIVISGSCGCLRGFFSFIF